MECTKVNLIEQNPPIKEDVLFNSCRFFNYLAEVVLKRSFIFQKTFVKNYKKCGGNLKRVTSSL